MQNLKLEEGKASRKVYVILRINSLGQGDATELDFFVDPDRLRLQKRLNFERSWKVTPREKQSESFRRSQGSSFRDYRRASNRSASDTRASGAGSSSSFNTRPLRPPPFVARAPRRPYSDESPQWLDIDSSPSYDPPSPTPNRATMGHGRASSSSSSLAPDAPGSSVKRKSFS